VERDAFIQACREGGAAIELALRRLDRSFHAALLRDARRVLRDPEAASDAVQETFIKVWRRCATFQGDSELLPWIRSILRHTVLDRLRRPEHESALDDDTVPATVASGFPAPDDDVCRRQLAACFRRCWERFEAAAPAHAAVMAWIVEDGMGNDEIARLLQRTPGATREFVSQCRKRARRHLAEWYELARGAR